MNWMARFDQSKCILCGECLSKCPVMHLSPKMAKKEKKRLLDNVPTRKALQKCTACFACNQICPNECNPASLIIERWNQHYNKYGVKARARFMMPDHKPNFRTYVADRLPAKEKKVISSWEDTSGVKEIFYPGCNFIIAPHLTDSKIFSDIAIRGSLDLCCGETLFRTGCYEQARQSAIKVMDWLALMGVKKMVVPCAAGYNMFKNVLPQHFGIMPEFKVTHILPWLMEKLDNNKITINNKLDMTITIQESCYAKIFGDEFMDMPRKLASAMGLTVIEEKLSRDMALCCGIGGGFSPNSGYHPADIMLGIFKSLKLAKNTKADAVMTYCAGCLHTLGLGHIMQPYNRQKLFHILEFLQMAAGEEFHSSTTMRALRTLEGTVVNQFPLLLSRKRVFLGKH